MKTRLHCITILGDTRQERNVLEGDRWSRIRPRISGLTYWHLHLALTLPIVDIEMLFLEPQDSIRLR